MSNMNIKQHLLIWCIAAMHLGLGVVCRLDFIADYYYFAYFISMPIVRWLLSASFIAVGLTVIIGGYNNFWQGYCNDRKDNEPNPKTVRRVLLFLLILCSIISNPLIILAVLMGYGAGFALMILVPAYWYGKFICGIAKHLLVKLKTKSGNDI